MSQSAPTVRELLLSCATLPTLPAAAMYVLKLAQEDKAEMDDLAQMIARDPALSVKILRAVNSPFYGLGQKVSTISQAVVLLGLHAVKTMVLGFSLVSQMRTNKGNGFNHLAYWRRSMYAATAARVIASKVLSGHEEDCFMAGLLMDIGALVMDQLLGDRYSEVFERAGTHNDLLVIESHALGITHAEASGVLARHWRLPEGLTVPMESHHAPMGVEDYSLKRITQVIWLAGRCGDIFTSSSAADSIAAVRKTCAELYGMDDLACDAMMCTIGQKTGELANLFEIR